MVQIVCSSCDKDLGQKEGTGGTTHSICPECCVGILREHHVRDEEIVATLQKNCPEMPPEEIARLLAQFPASA